MNWKKIAEKILFYLSWNPINRYIFETEIKRKSKLDLTNTKELVNRIGTFAPYTYELYHLNDYYGEATTLKKYAGVKNTYQLKLAVDHGVVFSKNTNQVGTDPGIPSAVTFSKPQKIIDEQFKKHVFAIGPYIHYAKNLLPKNKIAKMKKKNGRTLLVFPTHSTPSGTVEYDYNSLIKKIKELGQDFETILVCVYWKDILRGVDDIYRKAGLTCVTAGHVYDPNFLPRLRSIIELSDTCMGNSAGSNVGYAIYLKRPYYVFWQDEKVTGHKKEVKIITDETSSVGYKKVIKVLSKFSPKVTKEQKEIVGYYWGFDQVKSKKELKAIIDKTEKIYQDEKNRF